MKKMYFLAPVLCMALASCNVKADKATYHIEADKEAMKMELDSIQTKFENQEKDQDQIFQDYIAILKKYYDRHRSDSLGLELFCDLASVGWDEDELKAEYDKADTLIQNDSRVKRQIQLNENMAKTAVGCKYEDIAGPEAKTGEEISISKTLEGGKMVLLDFWASWCGPCRRCIKDELPAVAEKYADRLTILGIDVWERQREDLDEAMGQLPITWQVIYTGTGSESPADLYGVKYIPTLVLIDKDGTILARGGMEDIEKVLEQQ